MDFSDLGDQQASSGKKSRFDFSDLGDTSPTELSKIPQNGDLGSSVLDIAANAVKQTPIGMAAQGAQTVSNIFSKVMNALPVSVGQTGQRIAQVLDFPRRLSRAAAVGLENAPRALIPGGTPTSADVQAAVPRMVAALQPGYRPANAAEGLAAAAGENVPFLAAGAAPAAFEAMAPSFASRLSAPFIQSAALSAQNAAAQASDTGKVGAAGLAIPAMVEAAPPLFQGAKNVAAGAGKRLFSGIFGPSVEAIDARLQRPADLAQAKPPVQLSSDLATTMNGIQSEIKQMDNQAWDSLLKLKSEPQSDILGVIKKVRNQYRVTGGGPISDADQRAISALDRLSARISQIRQRGVPSNVEQMLDQQQLRNIVQSVSDDVNWQDPTASKMNEALMAVRAGLDNMLKKSNPEYAQIMAPIADRMDLLSNLRRSFNMGREEGQFVPTDTTASKFPLAAKEGRVATQADLERLNNFTGQDFLKQTRDYQLAQQFEPGATRPNGSRRVGAGAILGTAVGKMLGSPLIGSVAGGATGLYLDTQGGSVAGKLIDAYRRMTAPEMAANPAMAKYGAILDNAVRSGIPAEKANESLQRSDPMYRRFVLELIPAIQATSQQPIFSQVQDRLGFGLPPLPSEGSPLMIAPAPEPRPINFNPKRIARVIGPTEEALNRNKRRPLFKKAS